MKEYTKAKERKQKKRRNRQILLIALVVLAVAGIGGGVSFAKYYSVNHREGVSVASGLYFGSNYLSKNPGAITSINDIKSEATNLPASVNSAKWAGGVGSETTFTIEIRNYENHLLYNDNNLDVEYHVDFLMLDTPSGANYYIQKTGDASETRKALYEENSDGSTKTAVNMVSYDGTLKGGTLSTDTYTLTIQMVDEERYNNTKARVMAVAYPTAPDYLVNESNQQNRLLGVFQGVYSQIALSVDTKQFKVQQEADYNDTTWSDKVQDLSGLIYNVKTKGDIVTDGGESIAVKPQVIIKWKTDYLKISEYDEYYLAAKAEDENNKAAGKNDAEKWFYTEGGWTYLRVSAMPYTSIDVTFYKTEKFMEAMNKADTDLGKMTKADFEGLVDAYIPSGT